MLTLEDWRYDSTRSDCGNCGGGWYKFFVTERSSIDFRNVELDDGVVVSLPLVPGAQLVRVFPFGIDETTGEFNGTRENSFSPLLYEVSLSFSVSPAGIDVQNAEKILKQLCDPIIIACTNCCEVYLFNVETVICNEKVDFRKYPRVMRLNEVTRSYGTVTGRPQRIWTFSGASHSGELLTALACADFDELVTAG